DPIWAHRKNGEDTDADFDFAAWRQKHWDFAQIAVPKWVAAVKAQYGEASTKYAAVGYCFGAPYVCDLLAAEDVTAGAFAHPSFLKESHFHQIKRPLFMSCAEIDPYFDQSSRRRALEILQEEEKKWHLQLFCNVEHGFAVRGDPEIPHIRWSKEQSHRSIVSWFDLWLSQ
ncbi:dienelactone hydrolase, partial [Macrophomina phaseolina]